MKILYYSCFSGISGDMNLGAMVDLGVDGSYLADELKKLSIADEFELKIEKKEKMGISGTKVEVLLKNHKHTHKSKNEHSHVENHHIHSIHEHKHEDHHNHEHINHEHIHADKINHTHNNPSNHNHQHEKSHSHSHSHSHEHRNLKDIYRIIDESSLNENVKAISKKIFLVVGEAEAKVHGKSIEEIHFHEVGAVDSIVDIVGAAICFDYLKVDKIMASTVELGSGFVKCAHGLIPVPAPATLEILKEAPVHIGRVKSEAATPTGGAILKAMVDEYSDNIDFEIIKTAYGIGTKDFEIPNVLRVILAKIEEKPEGFGIKRENTIIEVNIDDMNPEILGYLEEKLFEVGALDIYKTPIIMKKGRLATKISILVDEKCEENVEKILFTETSTLGMRKYKVEKKFLQREFIKVPTKYGEVLVKLAVFNGEMLKFKGEYEVCKKLAKENNVSINDIYKEINCMDIEKIWRDNNDG